MKEEIYSIHRNDTWDLTYLPHNKKKLVLNGFTRESMTMARLLKDTKHGYFLRDSHIGMGLIMKRYFHL